MRGMATTYRNLGQSEKARELEVAVLETQRRTLGDEDLQTLWTMNNLVVTYCELGQFHIAEELGTTALKKRTEILGEDHPDTLITMSNLGWIYTKQEQFEPAEKILVVALEKQRKLLGEDLHPYTEQTAKHLAYTYRNLGKLKDAEELEALFDVQLHQQNLGPLRIPL
jgi:tetratricopeptide (TPR) repeat protein